MIAALADAFSRACEYVHVHWRLWIMSRKFFTYMSDAMYLVDDGHWFVFRDAPTWVLLWAHAYDRPPDGDHPHTGLAQRTHDQAMTELHLRLGKVKKVLRDALLAQGAPQEIADAMIGAQLAEGCLPMPLYPIDPFEPLLAMSQSGDYSGVVYTNYPAGGHVPTPGEGEATITPPQQGDQP